MARFNKIFLGPVSENKPQVREMPAAAATLPGTLVVQSSGEFAAATAGASAQLFIVQENYLTMAGVDTAYAEDDTLIGMVMLPEQIFAARVATGVNVTLDAPLTVGASGKIALATAEDYVFAYADEAYNNTSGSDQLVRIRAATGYLLPAA